MGIVDSDRFKRGFESPCPPRRFSKRLESLRASVNTGEDLARLFPLAAGQENIASRKPHDARGRASRIPVPQVAKAVGPEHDEVGADFPDQV